MNVKEKELERLRGNVVQRLDPDDHEIVIEYINKVADFLELQVNEELAEFKEGLMLEHERRLKLAREEIQLKIDRGVARKAYKRGKITGFQYATFAVLIVSFVAYVVSH